LQSLITVTVKRQEVLRNSVIKTIFISKDAFRFPKHTRHMHFDANLEKHWRFFAMKGKVSSGSAVSAPPVI
jgi:hypothetical protein